VRSRIQLMNSRKLTSVRAASASPLCPLLPRASIKLAVGSVTAVVTLRDPIRRQKDLSDSRFCVSHLTSSLLFIVVKHGSSRRPWWLQGNTVRLWSPLPCLSSVFLMILTIIFDDRSSSFDGRRSHLVSTYKPHLQSRPRSDLTAWARHIC